MTGSPPSPNDFIDGYVSGPSAATAPRRLALEQVGDARHIVLVEGITDQIAVEALAARCGIDLDHDGVVVAPMGGAHAIDTFLHAIGRRVNSAASMGGLCDRREAPVFRAALHRAGFGPVANDADLEQLGFFVCEADLEMELIRAVGAARILELLGEHGDLAAFRTLQKQAPWRDQPAEAQLHRFFRSKARRMHRYARVLVDAADAAPRPLLGVLGLL